MAERSRSSKDPAANDSAATGPARSGRRVLVAVPVYGTHRHLDQCLSSAAAITSDIVGVDTLVIDDGSPDLDFAAELAAMCAAYGVAHYRSPRNQGIPRTFNLAIRRAQTAGYESVVLLNSDVVAPPTIVDDLCAAAADPDVASVTAWSNQASAFSLDHAHRDERLAAVERVTEVASSLRTRFGSFGLDLPTGAGHCMLLTMEAVGRVGLMDPVFGRGYCEELDWCQRARIAGLHHVLALGSFVWHRGSATSDAVGLLGPTERTVPHNEAIIEARYPAFRRDVHQFFARDTFERAKNDALAAITIDAARRHGWVLQASATARASRRDERVTVRIDPVNSSAPIAFEWIGLTASAGVLGDDPIKTAADLVGQPAAEVQVFDTGHVAELARLHGAALGIDAIVRRPYPSRVI